MFTNTGRNMAVNRQSYGKNRTGNGTRVNQGPGCHGSTKSQFSGRDSSTFDNRGVNGPKFDQMRNSTEKRNTPVSGKTDAINNNSKENSDRHETEKRLTSENVAPEQNGMVKAINTYPNNSSRLNSRNNGTNFYPRGRKNNRFGMNGHNRGGVNRNFIPGRNGGNYQRPPDAFVPVENIAQVNFIPLASLPMAPYSECEVNCPECQACYNNGFIPQYYTVPAIQYLPPVPFNSSLGANYVTDPLTLSPLTPTPATTPSSSDSSGSCDLPGASRCKYLASGDGRELASQPMVPFYQSHLASPSADNYYPSEGPQINVSSDMLGPTPMVNNGRELVANGGQVNQRIYGGQVADVQVYTGPPPINNGYWLPVQGGYPLPRPVEANYVLEQSQEAESSLINSSQMMFINSTPNLGLQRESYQVLDKI